MYLRLSIGVTEMTTTEQAPYHTTAPYYDSAHVTVWFTLQHLDIEPEQGCKPFCWECESNRHSWDNYLANVQARHASNVAHKMRIIAMSDDEFNTYMLATYGPFSASDLVDTLPEF